jgi:predicted ABC-type sugar transport system permease subunit
MRTKDITKPMTLMDNYTSWQLVILAVQVIVAVLAKKRYVSAVNE